MGRVQQLTTGLKLPMIGNATELKPDGIEAKRNWSKAEIHEVKSTK